MKKKRQKAGIWNTTANIKQILKDYPQTIMFNGHIHDGLGAIELKQTSNF